MEVFLFQSVLCYVWASIELSCHCIDFDTDVNSPAVCMHTCGGGES